MSAIRRGGLFSFLLACSFVSPLSTSCASGGGGAPPPADTEQARATGTAATPAGNPARQEIESRQSGFTPSDFVDVAANWDVDLVRLYLDAGADPNEPHEGKTTALGQAALFDRHETIDLLVSRGARPNDYSQDESPLFIAALRDNVDALKALIDAKADLDQPGRRDSPGETALWHACSAGSWDSARLLLEAGADPNLSPGSGGPIVQAATAGHVPTVRLLLEKGAKGEDLANALYFAMFQGRSDTVRLLLESGVPVPANWRSLVREGHVTHPEVKKLLAKPPKPGAAAKGGTTPARPSVPSSAKAVATVLAPGEAEGSVVVWPAKKANPVKRHPLKHAWALKAHDGWRVVLADRPLERRAVDSWARDAKPPRDAKLRAVLVSLAETRTIVESQILVGGRIVKADTRVFEAGPFDGKALAGKFTMSVGVEVMGSSYSFDGAFVAPLLDPWDDGIPPEEAARAEATEPARTFRAYEKALRERDVAALVRLFPEAFGQASDPNELREYLVTFRAEQLSETKLRATTLDDESASFLVAGRDEAGWPRTKTVSLSKQGSDWVVRN